MLHSTIFLFGALISALFLTASNTVESFLLKGFIDGSSLVLEKADERFLELINNLLNKSHIGLAGDGLKRLTDAAENKLSSVQDKGDNVASIILSPFTEGNSSLLLSPVVLSESVLSDLADTGRSVLKLALPLKDEDITPLPRTTVGQIINTISNVSLPIETAATRAAVKETFNAIPGEVYALRSSFAKILRE